MDFIRLLISSPKLLIAGTILTIAVVAVPITMTLVNQQQDIRQRAQVAEPTPTNSPTCGECGFEESSLWYTTCKENTSYTCPGGGTCSLVSERYVCVGGTATTPTPTPTPFYNYSIPSITPPTGFPTTTASFDFNNGLDHCRPNTQSCETVLGEYDTGNDCSAYLGVPARVCRTDGYVAGVSSVIGCPTLTTDKFVQYCLPITKVPPTGWTPIVADVNACTNYNGISSLCYKSTYQVTLTTPTATFTPVPPTATNVPGVPTSTFTPVPPTATGTTAQSLTCDPIKDGVIDLLDFNLWRDEAFFGTEGKKTDCFMPDEKVDLLDFQVWKDIAILKIKQPF